MAYRFSPGACCSCQSADCSICSDNFDRSDSTDVDTGSTCGWTEVSGGWEIVSNSLRVTSSKTNAVCICDAAHSGGRSSVSATVAVRTTGSDKLRVIINYQDSSNYHFVELTYAIFGATAALWQRVGGVNTQLGSAVGITAAPSTTKTVTICFSEGVLSATISNSPFNVVLAAAVAMPGAANLAGVGTGGTASGTISFEDWTLTKAYDTEDPLCTRCASNCQCCSNGPADASYVVDLGAASLTDEKCNACDTIAGEYTLAFVSSCKWEYTSPTICSQSDCTGRTSGTAIRITLEMLTDTTADPDKCFWRLTLRSFAPGGADDTYGGQCDGIAQWASDEEEATLDCADSEWSVHKVPGQAGGTYRGTSVGWAFDDEDWNLMCDGLTNDTVTIRRVA